MNSSLIKWELLESTKNEYKSYESGDSFSTIKKGNYKGCEFLLFETHECYYDRGLKVNSFKTTSSQILPINENKNNPKES